MGGLALFLFGMHMLSASIEKMSGSKLTKILEKLTGSVWKSVALGAIITAIVQSSGATTVITVGLVNSGILKLGQAIGIIMGSNIGTTVTGHLLRLTEISGTSGIMQFLKTYHRRNSHRLRHAFYRYGYYGKQPYAPS